MLHRIPNTQDLSRLYDELGKRGAPVVGKYVKWPYKVSSDEFLIALSSDMCRYDPRLLGVLIGWLPEFILTLNPLKLRKLILNTDTPQVMGVITSFIRANTQNSEIIYIFDYLIRGLRPVSAQLFFKGIYPLGGNLMQHAAAFSLKEFSNWGFYCSDRPTIDIHHKTRVGHYTKDARMQILKTLLQQKRHIQISDYLEALSHSISRQQALADLKHLPTLTPSGKGRSTTWKLR